MLLLGNSTIFEPFLSRITGGPTFEKASAKHAATSLAGFVVSKVPTTSRSRSSAGVVVQAHNPRTADVAIMILMVRRSEEHTSELQSLMRISYAVFCLKKKNINITKTLNTYI